jgi:hypothetical protein
MYLFVRFSYQLTSQLVRCVHVCVYNLIGVEEEGKKGI